MSLGDALRDPYEVMTVSIDHLFVDRSWRTRSPQKALDKLQRIVKFEPSQFTMLVVNERPWEDNAPPPSKWRIVRWFKERFGRQHLWYSILDGAVRWELAKLNGISEVPVLVKHIKPEEEPSFFASLNRLTP